MGEWSSTLEQEVHHLHCGFPSELGYFKSSCRGLFFVSMGWSEPNNVTFSPCNTNFNRGTSSKNLNFTHPEQDFYRGTPLETRLGCFGLLLFFNQRTITYNILSRNNIKNMHSQRYDTLKTHMKQLAMRYDSPLLRCSAIRFRFNTMRFDAIRCNVKNMITFISLVQTDSKS